jgi:hypothetical protein
MGVRGEGKGGEKIWRIFFKTFNIHLEGRACPPFGGSLEATPRPHFAMVTPLPPEGEQRVFLNADVPLGA